MFKEEDEERVAWEGVKAEEVNECHNSPDLIANQCKQFVVHEALQETPLTTTPSDCPVCTAALATR